MAGRKDRAVEAPNAGVVDHNSSNCQVVILHSRPTDTTPSRKGLSETDFVNVVQRSQSCDGGFARVICAKLGFVRHKNRSSLPDQVS